jgi:hypothetical protein
MATCVVDVRGTGTTSLAGVSDGGDKTAGAAVGEAAAMAIIGARMGDGLEANITYWRSWKG